MKYLITMSAAELGRLQKSIRELLREKSRSELTNLIQTKKALQKSEKMLREFLSLLPQTVCEIDDKGNLTFANRQAFKTLGYSREDFETGSDILQILEPSDRERARANLQNLPEGAALTGHEYTAVKRDGTPFPVKIFPTPILHGNRTVGVRGKVIKITGHERELEEFARNQELESIGVLAGGIAHDFNNLLTAVLGNITLAKMNLQPEVKASLRLEDAEKAIMRAKDLTQQLLTLSKGGAPVTRQVSIGTLIEESASFALSGSNVHCEFTASPDLWPVEVNESQICQVIHNLVINSDQAMPKGGVIRIRCENVSTGDNDPFPPTAGNYVKVSIRDHGSGIPAVILTRIFEPYFTTKRKGSGLGLATVFSIVRTHGGHIAVASAPGEGTTFEIYLPASEAAPPAFEPVNRTIDSRKAKILVMDDDDMIREVACEMLQKYGHVVEPARDGAEAVRMVRSAKEFGRAYDVVVLDLTVPGGMGAEESVKRLAEIDPFLKLFVSSGYSDAPAMIDYKKYGFAGSVAKPYKYDDFARAIAEVLESSP
jgi:PAS domain S-box-containing protein